MQISMGIKCLYSLIEKHSADAICLRRLEEYAGKAVALDTPGFLYKALYGNVPGSHLVKLGSLAVTLRGLGIEPVFVFDGRAPLAAKQKENEVRAERKRKNLEQIDQLEVSLKTARMDAATAATSPPAQTNQPTATSATFNDPNAPPSIVVPETPAAKARQLEQALEKARRQVIHVTKQHVEQSKELLRLMGMRVYQSPSEGEGLCATLNRLGHVYAVLTDDGDAMAFGALRVVRGVGSAGQHDEGVVEYDVSRVRRGFGLDADEMVELALLCGCDFTEKLIGIGAVNALRLIRKHHTVDQVLAAMTETERQKRVPPADFTPDEARAVFRSFLCTPGLPDGTAALERVAYDHFAVLDFVRDKLDHPHAVVESWSQMILGHVPVCVLSAPPRLRPESPSPRAPSPPKDISKRPHDAPVVFETTPAPLLASQQATDDFATDCEYDELLCLAADRAIDAHIEQQRNREPLVSAPTDETDHNTSLFD